MDKISEISGRETYWGDYRRALIGVFCSFLFLWPKACFALQMAVFSGKNQSESYGLSDKNRISTRIYEFMETSHFT